MKKFLITLYGRKFVRNIVAYVIHQKFNIRTDYKSQDLSDSIEFIDVLRNSDLDSNELEIWLISTFKNRYEVETKAVIDNDSMYRYSEIVDWLRMNEIQILNCIDTFLKNTTKNNYTINELGMMLLGHLKAELDIARKVRD